MLFIVQAHEFRSLLAEQKNITQTVIFHFQTLHLFLDDLIENVEQDIYGRTAPSSGGLLILHEWTSEQVLNQYLLLNPLSHSYNT